jgi:hypothetical protein
MGVVEYWSIGVVGPIATSQQSNYVFGVYFAAAALMFFTFTSKFKVLPARG